MFDAQWNHPCSTVRSSNVSRSQLFDHGKDRHQACPGEICATTIIFVFVNEFFPFPFTVYLRTVFILSIKERIESIGVAIASSIILRHEHGRWLELIGKGVALVDVEELIQVRKSYMGSELQMEQGSLTVLTIVVVLSVLIVA